MAALLDEEHGQKKGQSARELAEQVVRKKKKIKNKITSNETLKK
jgi:hypothetical protein